MFTIKRRILLVLRTVGRDADLIRQGAFASNKTPEDFLVESAVASAHEVLDTKRDVIVSREGFCSILQELAQPPVKKAALDRLQVAQGTSPRLLRPTDHLSSFDCGVEAVNEFLHKSANSWHQGHCAVTYVVCRSGVAVAGYYTLVAGSIRPEGPSHTLRSDFGGDPIPTVVVARLGVDKSAQGEGLGRVLLKSASLEALAIAERVGVRTLIVEGRDDAADFYRSFGFDPVPENPRRRYLHIKDLKHSLG